MPPTQGLGLWCPGGASDAPGGGAQPQVPPAHPSHPPGCGQSTQGPASLPSQGRCVPTLGWTSDCAVALPAPGRCLGQSTLGATPGLPRLGMQLEPLAPWQADGQGQHRAALPRRGAGLHDAASLPGPLVSHKRQSLLQKCAGWGRRPPLPCVALWPVHPEPTGMGGGRRCPRRLALHPWGPPWVELPLLTTTWPTQRLESLPLFCLSNICKNFCLWSRVHACFPRAPPTPGTWPSAAAGASGERSTGQELPREASALTDSLRPCGGLRWTPSPLPLHSVSLPRAAGASSIFQMLTARRVLH